MSEPIRKKASGICLLAAGDCGPGDRQSWPIEHYTSLVRPVLAAADLRTVNSMRQYSLRGTPSERAPHGRQPPEMAKILTDCAFDAVTIANNHMYDFGPDALLDTRALLLDKGIRVTGAGRNLTEARQPAIVERSGIKVGFLGYSALLPPGCEAGTDKPGIAPLRVKTSYETRGPHAPVRVRTEPDRHDLQMLLDDIASLRRQVDIVIPSLHYGLVWLPRIIADYQVAVSHACIDAGADLVLGHAPHIPKAIEVYKGKAIFYSLSTFCLTKPFPAPPWKEAPWVHGAVRNHVDQDPEYPLLPFGKHAKWSLLAKAVLSKEGVERASFLPMMIDKQYRPEVLRNGDPRFSEMVRYMEWASDGFDHAFAVERDEVVVRGKGEA